MVVAERESGIDLIGRVPWGTHFCLFYETGDDLSDILISFFEAGLRNNEFCMCVTSDPVNANEMKRLMRAALPDFDDRLNKGQIEVIPYTEWYLIDGVFDHKRVLEGWNDKLRQAQEKGFEGARLTGNTFWLDKPIWNDFLEYEQAIDGAVDGRNIIVLCTYSLDRCDAGDILDVVSTHNFALTRREGEWKLIENADVRETKKALRESEERYRIVADNTYDWEFWLSPEGRVLYTSPSCERITGYPAGELIKNPGLLYDITHPEDRVAFQAHIHTQQLSSHGDLEFRIIAKNGEVRWIHHLCQPVYDKDGRFLGTRGSNRDITERKRAEEALKFSEERAQRLLEQSFDAVIIHANEHIVFANDTAVKLLGGKTQEDFLGKPVLSIVHPEYMDIVKERIKMNLNGLPSPVNEEKFLRLDGSPVDVEVTAINDIYQSKPAIRVIFRDISRRKHAEEALRESEEKLRSFFDLPLIGMALTTSEKRWIYANDRICEILGFSREELFQLTWDKITHPDDLDNDLEHFNRLLSGEIDSYTIEKRFMRKEGRIVHTQISIGCVRNPDNSVRYIAGLMDDITERKRAEEELKAAKAQAELYVDLMGHDISNIHQAALGYLELARDVPGDAREEYLDEAMEALKRSTRLINNVRKLQKFQDNRVQADDVDVCAVLVGVHREYATTPGKTVSKTVTLNLNGCTHCHVRADELLHDVFSNLVGNAVKHTGDHAHVSISLDMVREDSIEYCRVRVEDDGPGILDESKKTLFNRSLKGTPRAKGMGLGLYIVKTLVENYGGRVWAEDRVSGDHTKGARFVVMLPAIGK